MLPDKRWQLADWAVRIALPVWSLPEEETLAPDFLCDVERLERENAGTTGLDCLKVLGHWSEPVHNGVPAEVKVQVRAALNKTGFGPSAKAVLVNSGLPLLLWSRSRELCELYALQKAERLAAPSVGFDLWLAGSVSTSVLIGNIRPSLGAWQWTG